MHTAHINSIETHRYTDTHEFIGSLKFLSSNFVHNHFCVESTRIYLCVRERVCKRERARDSVYVRAMKSDKDRETIETNASVR